MDKQSRVKVVRVEAVPGAVPQQVGKHHEVPVTYHLENGQTVAGKLSLGDMEAVMQRLQELPCTPEGLYATFSGQRYSGVVHDLEEAS